MHKSSRTAASHSPLIVTADDLGLTVGITDGILEAHQEGVVTAASLIATGTAFEYASSAVAGHPQLELGVHLCLSEERPLLAGLRTVTGQDGEFLDRWHLIRRLLLHRIDLDEVQRCWAAQIERVLEAGIRPTFINSHGHLHGFPSLLPIVVRLARRYSIPAIRRPVDFVRSGSARDIGRGALVSTSTLWAFRHAPDAPWTPESFLGLSESGRLDQRELQRLIAHAHGVTELMTHPGRADAETVRRYGHWRYRWEDELQALKDARAMHLTLTTFLAQSAGK